MFDIILSVEPLANLASSPRREWLPRRFEKGFQLLKINIKYEIILCTNPNKLPAQHFSDTLRHPGTLLRRGRQRTQATATANQQGGQQRSNGQSRQQTAPSNRRHRQQRQRGASANTQTSAAQNNRSPPNLSAPPLIPPSATQVRILISLLNLLSSMLSPHQESPSLFQPGLTNHLHHILRSILLLRLCQPHSP